MGQSLQLSSFLEFSPKFPSDKRNGLGVGGGWVGGGGLSERPRGEKQQQNRNKFCKGSVRSRKNRSLRTGRRSLNTRRMRGTCNVMHIEPSSSISVMRRPTSPQLSSSAALDNLSPNLKGPLHTSSSHVMSHATLSRNGWLIYAWEKRSTPRGLGLSLIHI